MRAAPDERAPFARADAEGDERVMCPASAGKLRCTLVEASLNLSFARLGLYDHELSRQLREIGAAHHRQIGPTGGRVTRYIEDNSNFGADGPFFRIIREGLQGLANGEDYFDLLADDVVFEYVISVPGYPKRVEGRQNIIDLYSDYDSFMAVNSADALHVYRDPAASVVILEYEVHGESVQTGRPYNNRFVSIVTIKDGKVTRWRDYLDPVAVFDAAGWPGGQG